MAKVRTAAKHIALLRGINVGGKNLLPMKGLVDIFQQAGCADVRTYIQSGNVLFTAAAKVERALGASISRLIEAEFGFSIPVVLRTREELGATIEANPFLASGVDPKALHVYFLRDTPNKEAVATLDPSRSLPDTFIVQGREVYLNLPNGMARTKLTNAWFDSRLKTVSTARNWNTVLKLHELMSG